MPRDKATGSIFAPHHPGAQMANVMLAEPMWWRDDKQYRPTNVGAYAMH